MTEVELRTGDSSDSVTVIDRVRSRRYTLHLPEQPAISATDPDAFDYPVDRAITFETERMRVPNIYALLVRDEAGTVLDTVDHDGHFDGDAGEYVVELCAPVKTYFRAEGPLTVAADDREMEVEFPRRRRVEMGVRTYLKRPSVAVTATDDLRDVAGAIEAMGSVLQTTSPERSFPTLRGHPPRIRIGDSPEIPPAATPPETGITVEVSPDIADLLAVSPAVFYLGARLRLGDDTRVSTDTGFETRLGTDTVEEATRLLERSFFLDCLSRVHGSYDVSCVEHDRLADDLPIDLAAAYDRSPAERLEAYMSVPYGDIEPHLPEWPVAACIEPSVDRLPALPYALNELALVRPVSPDRYTGESARGVAFDAFVSEGPTRAASEVYAADAAFVDVPETDATDQLWVGDDIPLNANKFVAAGHRHRHERSSTRPDAIQVALVCNDPDMLAEATTGRDVYGTHAAIPFELEVHENLRRAELAAVLESRSHLVHFIGHSTGAGLECPDGDLDVASLDAVGAETFLLNACQSYRQGLELVSRGAIGGVVTLSDIGTDTAGEVGVTLARVLNQGFSLRAALDIARATSVVGGQYLIVGDDGVSIAQNESGTPYLCVLTDGEDALELSIRTYPTVEWGLGTVFAPELDGRRFLAGRTRGPLAVEASAVREFLRLQDVPVQYGEQLYFSEEFDASVLG